MKKGIILIAAIAVAGIFSSCKKEYTCVCSATVGGVTSSAEVKSGTKMKKADAETWCNTGDMTSSGVAVDCKLK